MFRVIFTEEDMLKENHFPIIAHINEAYNSNLIEFMKDINKGIGTGYDYTCSSFWDELDDYDKENISHYDGIMIETEDGEELCLSMKEMLDYLMLLQSKLASANSELTGKMTVLLDEYKTVYKDALQ